MTYRIRTLAALAGTLLSLVAISGPANAEDPNEDHRPCVTTREYRGAFQHDLNRRQLERRWDVRGLGTDLGESSVFGIKVEIIAYPRCDFPMEQAWYGALYKLRNDMMVGTTSHRVYG